jgi:hypothetical protein
MGSLESRPDLGAGDRAPAVVGVERTGLKCALPDPFATQALAEHGARMPPRRVAEIDLDRARKHARG